MWWQGAPNRFARCSPSKGRNSRYTLEITESAEADLDQITEYLGIELANPPAALAVLDEIGQVSDAIEVTPEMFPLCADSRLAEMGYRKAIVRSYILVYEIDRAARLVKVLRLFHESENYADKL